LNSRSGIGATSMIFQGYPNSLKGGNTVNGNLVYHSGSEWVSF
jgi:hypothetical protein